MIDFGITEIRTGYVDDDNLQHIDCWFSDDENAEGSSVALVCLDTGKVVYFDNKFRSSKRVTKAIDKVKAEMKLKSTMQKVIEASHISDLNKKMEEMCAEGWEAVGSHIATIKEEYNQYAGNQQRKVVRVYQYSQSMKKKP